MNFQTALNFEGKHLKILSISVLLFVQSICIAAQSNKEVVIITTKSNEQLKGYILDESGGKILFYSKSTKDTISILEFNLKSIHMVRDKFIYAKGRYHKKKGWVNSIGLNTGNLLLAWPLQSVPAPLNSLIEYKIYRLVHPNVGFGFGVDRKLITTSQLGYEYYTHYKFADVFAYGKVYLSNDRRRLYLESKLGYGIALENEIIFGCPYCDDPLPLAQRYTSGRMFQIGIGLEFASRRNLKWGINWALVTNRTTLEEDIYPEGGKTPADGVIDFTSEKKVLPGIMLGIRFYL